MNRIEDTSGIVHWRLHKGTTQPLCVQTARYWYDVNPTKRRFVTCLLCVAHEDEWREIYDP